MIKIESFLFFSRLMVRRSFETTTSWQSLELLPQFSTHPDVYFGVTFVTTLATEHALLLSQSQSRGNDWFFNRALNLKVSQANQYFWRLFVFHIVFRRFSPSFLTCIGPRHYAYSAMWLIRPWSLIIFGYTKRISIFVPFVIWEDFVWRHFLTSFQPLPHFQSCSAWRQSLLRMLGLGNFLLLLRKFCSTPNCHCSGFRNSVRICNEPKMCSQQLLSMQPFL